MSENIDYYNLWQPELREALKDWWKSLEDNRGERARLRRCADPLMASLEKGSFRLRQKLLYQKLPKRINQPEIIGTIAACLAHVEEDDESMSFAKQLAKPSKFGDEPRLSELRFLQLQKAKTWQDFFTFLRRAVILLDKKANICSLADDIIQWGLEFSPSNYFVSRFKPAQSLKYRWAEEYYTQLLHLEAKPNKKEA